MGIVKIVVAVVVWEEATRAAVGVDFGADIGGEHIPSVLEEGMNTDVVQLTVNILANPIVVVVRHEEAIN